MSKRTLTQTIWNEFKKSIVDLDVLQNIPNIKPLSCTVNEFIHDMKHITNYISDISQSNPEMKIDQKELFIKISELGLTVIRTYIPDNTSDEDISKNDKNFLGLFRNIFIFLYFNSLDKHLNFNELSTNKFFDNFIYLFEKFEKMSILIENYNITELLSILNDNKKYYQNLLLTSVTSQQKEFISTLHQNNIYTNKILEIFFDSTIKHFGVETSQIEYTLYKFTKNFPYINENISPFMQKYKQAYLDDLDNFFDTILTFNSIDNGNGTISQEIKQTAFSPHYKTYVALNFLLTYAMKDICTIYNEESNIKILKDVQSTDREINNFKNILSYSCDKNIAPIILKTIKSIYPIIMEQHKNNKTAKANIDSVMKELFTVERELNLMNLMNDTSKQITYQKKKI